MRAAVIQALRPGQVRRSSSRLQRGLLIGLLACCGIGLPAGAAETAQPELAGRLDALLPAQALLLGEQHDVSDHQDIARSVVQTLAKRGQLAAVVLEMLPAGSSSAHMPRSSPAQTVQQTLGWNEGAWPWASYGPLVMAAVEAGVTVLGGNLPAQAMRPAMARAELDQRLPTDALDEQKQLMREGHCGLLPESQIAPMARIQIARDLSLADTLQAAVKAAGPGQLVLMVSGSVHADKRLGVPAHLPPALQVRSVRLLASGQPSGSGRFDAHWPTGPAPAIDHCAGLREHFKKRAP